jgi:hypothetical protein
MSVVEGKADINGSLLKGLLFDPKQTWDTLARFLAILSGRRRSAAAKLGWIVVARGLVLEDRRKAWLHSLAGTNDDMSRFGVMHPCGVGRCTEGDQKA